MRSKKNEKNIVSQRRYIVTGQIISSPNLFAKALAPTTSNVDYIWR
jgi:hypothetical protein